MIRRLRIFDSLSDSSGLNTVLANDIPSIAVGIFLGFTGASIIIISDLIGDLSTAMSGIETAYGRPFGNMEPVPMLRFAQGGDVDDDVLETEEEIITPEY